MYLFVDTEANGIVRHRNAPAANVWNWPRLVQIAWVLTDENGGELSTQSFIVRPEGFKVTKRIERERGITTETAMRAGAEIGEVLAAFAHAADKAEAIAGHNVEYERRVIEAELHRLGNPASPFAGKKLYCTMRTSTTLCGLRGGPFGYKWPKLQELHRTLFGSEFDPAHEAIADARACARCFFELKRRGIMDDHVLFEDIERHAAFNSWFDLGRYVDDVRRRFDDRGITDRQRAALARIRAMLARWAQKRVSQHARARRGGASERLPG